MGGGLGPLGRIGSFRTRFHFSRSRAMVSAGESFPRTRPTNGGCGWFRSHPCRGRHHPGTPMVMNCV